MVYSTDYDKIGRNSTNISPSVTGQVFYENRFVEEHTMPTLEWIGKSKVINHHQEVPFRVLERQYSYDEQGQHEEDNGSENMIIRGDNLEALKALLPRYEGRVKCIYIEMKAPKLIQINYSSAVLPRGYIFGKRVHFAGRVDPGCFCFMEVAA